MKRRNSGPPPVYTRQTFTPQFLAVVRQLRATVANKPQKALHELKIVRDLVGLDSIQEVALYPEPCRGLHRNHDFDIL